jgi:hypothetical protein
MYKKRKDIAQVNDRVRGLHSFPHEAFIKTRTATCKLAWAEQLPAFSPSWSFSSVGTTQVIRVRSHQGNFTSVYSLNSVKIRACREKPENSKTKSIFMAN